MEKCDCSRAATLANCPCRRVADEIFMLKYERRKLLTVRSNGMLIGEYLSSYLLRHLMLLRLPLSWRDVFVE